MTHFNLKTFSGLINNQPVTLHNARELHEFLQISTRFDIWIQRRISEYNFIENLDFIGVIKFERTEAGFFGKREKEIKEYHITLDMAKELCMLERSELGQQARRYFIKMEKQAILEIPRLQVENAQLHAKLTALLPANAVSVGKDRYIELLENENRLLKTKPVRQIKRPNTPLSAVEKSQILQLSAQGLQKAEIAKRLNRSASAVRAVIRENQGK